ncbi:phosphodiesterase [bacterium BMS3Abin01]|nr:phosphodiesterase [bacterium BMS3Abin01]
MNMYAVISDIHANLEALGAVLADADMAGADRLVCLGDLVGYGPDPNRCVSLVREAADAVVAGNHDLAAVGRLDISWFNDTARRAIRWTAARLEPDISSYIASLPLERRIGDTLMVHGSPRNPLEEYLLDGYAARSSFGSDDFHLCLVGHSHRPLVFMLAANGEVTMMEPGVDTLLELRDSHRYIVNAGSVGQPRDRNPAAAYCLYDPEGQVIAFRRTAYAVERTQEKMRAAGLPRSLIDRLGDGR